MSDSKIIKVPEGYNQVNPFIISDDAAATIDFITEVFGGQEDENARTYDDDGSIFHSEVRIGKSTIMLAQRKKEWRFTPAFLQVYVANVAETLARAEASGAKVITRPTEFIGVKFSRIQDKQRNIWWVYEQLETYDWESQFDENSGEEWLPTKESTYIHDTIIEAMNELAKD